MKISENLYAFLWVTPNQNNCNTFFINGKRKILVDPGHYHLFRHIEDKLSELSLSPQDIDMVIVTHCHPDHLEGIKIFFGTSTSIAIHKAEIDFIRQVAPHYVDGLGVSNFEPDILLQKGSLKIEEVNLQVIPTPGHSPGSISLYWSDKKALITGDVVFKQGVGRTDLPGGNGEILKESIKKLSLLEVEDLLPGHGEIVSGRELVKTNFQEIERLWFGYL
ncbi:MAG: MBL fold metallo-hydrolase [Desulfatiglandales bacterium]|jgi:glyoxylase-like metal-dependent hydrolase (beta-lactamase superfamily II)|nr:MBL fold metallo-hydrolase [Desulfatiglandales bacterium]